MSPDPLLLRLFLLALVGLDVALLERASHGFNSAEAMLLFAVASAQAGLLAVWLVAGSGRLGRRIVFCGVAFVLSQSAFARYSEMKLPEDDVVQVIGNVPFALGLLFVLLLWRFIKERYAGLGVRVAPLAPRPRQFSTFELLSLVTMAAVGFSFWHYFRAIQDTRQLDAFLLPMRIIAAMLAVRATCAERITVAAVAAPFSVAMAAPFAVGLTSGYSPDIIFYAVMQLTLDTAIFMAMLLVLRVAGVRLFGGATSDAGDDVPPSALTEGTL